MRAPALDGRLAALLGRVWRSLPGAAARAAALGFPWTAVSTPFVRWQGDQAIAHVGVIELPLVMDGRRVRVGSIHAVCTDPAARGQGHCRALMEEALAFCDTRYETVVLTTLIPDLYVKFGFRPLREHGFVRPLPAAAFGRAIDVVRPLSAAASDDVRLLRRLLAERAPVSRRLGSREDGTVLVVALLLTWGDFSRVHHHATLDVITVHEVRDRTLVLYDVVGPMLPALEQLTEGIDADRVIVLFPPERLGDGFHPEPWDAADAQRLGVDDTVLMARGPFVQTGPFMLQPLSRT
jgi:ribosomal protein S18 acetylase RimI-like enzyme